MLAQAFAAGIGAAIVAFAMDRMTRRGQAIFGLCCLCISVVIVAATIIALR